MKILYVTPFAFVPPTSGATIRMFQLLSHLASRHEVTVVGWGTEADAAAIVRALPSVRAVHLVPQSRDGSSRRLGQLRAILSRSSYHEFSLVGAGIRQAIARVLAAERFDAVHASMSQMGPLLAGRSALKVADAQNIEHDVFRRNYEALTGGFRKLHYWLEWKKHRREELSNWKRADLVLATSERDARMIADLAPDVRCRILPNGVDLRAFVPSAAPPESGTLVFTGTMDYLPNLDGIGWFLDEVFPLVLRSLPDATLFVVGKNPPPSLQRRASRNVVVTGMVDDVRPWISRAMACIVPLRSGGGTRLKVLEAFAMGKPVVSTTIGCEGIDVVEGQEALLADTPSAFADAVVRVLADARLRSGLASAGRQLASDSYGWQAIGARLLAYYDELFEERRRLGQVPRGEDR